MSDPFAPPSRTPEPEKPGEQVTQKIGYEPSSTYPAATAPGAYPAAAAPGAYPAATAPGAYEPTPYGGTPGTTTGVVGTPYPGGPAEPSDSRGWVIAGFLLFWPMGIAALFPSLRASRAIGAGDLQTAATEAASAKKRGIVAIIVAAAMIVLYVIMWVALAGLFLANMQNLEDGLSSSESGTPLEEITEGLVEGDPSTELPAEAVETSPSDLTVGQCLLSTSMTGGEDTLHVVPCEIPHGAEVYAQLPLTQDTYPTTDEAFLAEYELCAPAFDEFAGIAYLESALEYWSEMPSEEAWAAGNHNITCIIESYDGDVVTGTLKGAAY
ncbi:CD225/dispanin family protein [Antribacter gilvus]|uniref:CD225/dispanin family protein n=1 Tax=Antribacter gilvus TaxID=2304675 RepID=UPI000F7913EA|nr:CD225/dispanin family protein [Antribacter gilvus]